MTAGNIRNYDVNTLCTILKTWVDAKGARAAKVGSNLSDMTTGRQIEWFDATSGQIRHARRLFLTWRGYMGIAAHSTNIEDAVWILHGAATLSLSDLPVLSSPYLPAITDARAQ